MVEVARGTDGIATLTLQRPPANVLSTALLRAIIAAIKELEADPAVDVVILRSSCRNIFSAGLDLMEMVQPADMPSDQFRERLRQFWRSVQDCWALLYGSHLATIAAVNGHATAAGCELALVCDHRVAVDGPYTTGLNEAQFGLVAPAWFIPPLRSAVGERQCDRLVQRGTLVKFDEAYRLGMFDELCTADELMDRAYVAAKEWRAPNRTLSNCRTAAKRMMRQPNLDVLLKHRDEDERLFLRIAMAQETQAALAAYAASLSKRK